MSIKLYDKATYIGKKMPRKKGTQYTVLKVISDKGELVLRETGNNTFNVKFEEVLELMKGDQHVITKINRKRGTR